MEPYGAPADLTLPSDQIIAIPIPTPQPLFANVLHYLSAWQKITQQSSQPVELLATPLSTLANPLRPSNFQLQDQFSENNTPIPLTNADDLNHISMCCIETILVLISIEKDACSVLKEAKQK
jgi:hypothetical protein